MILVALVALGVVLASYATLAYLHSTSTGGATPLVVYTYGSLLGGGCGGSTIQGLLDAFDRANDASVQVVCPSGTLVSTLLSEKNAPGADVVVGLDEITAPEAVANGLLVPYASPALGNVNATLVAELGTGHYVTPYEWGYLALDYNLSLVNSTGGAVSHATFSDFAQNSTWASNLMIEDPTLDITGEEFLLWEIAYEQYLAHGDWTGWWQSVDPYLKVVPDWSTAWTDFTAPTQSQPMIASYAVDPATQAYYGYPTTFNATVSWLNGTAYGWRTVYGLGVVNGTRHLALDEKFVDWFLSPAVQGELPTTEWEYPANDSTPIPGIFNYSIAPASITPLNGEISSAAIVSSLPGWLDEWQTIENQYG